MPISSPEKLCHPANCAECCNGEKEKKVAEVPDKKGEVGSPMYLEEEVVLEVAETEIADEKTPEKKVEKQPEALPESNKVQKETLPQPQALAVPQSQEVTNPEESLPPDKTASQKLHEDQVLTEEAENLKTGEAELKSIQDRLYGGDLLSRQSFSKILFRKRGSIVFRVLPISAFAGVLAFILVMVKSASPNLYLLPDLKHPFVVQVYGIILSFVIVARTKVALSRYFNGMGTVHKMSTRWVDSFTSLLGFLRSSADLHPPGSPKQEACMAIGLALLHWGTLAHALAINSLQTTQLGLDEGVWETRLVEMEAPETLTFDSDLSIAEMKNFALKAKGRSKIQKSAIAGDKRLSISDGTGSTFVEKDFENSSKRLLQKLGVYGGLMPEEVQRLHGATDKVAIVLMWMEEAVSRGQVQGVILTGPPILSRVYAEIGNGLEGYNEAYRIALVPFPLCFAQLIAWAVVIFVFLCPMVAFVFTGGVVLTFMLTMFSIAGFWGLNRIAIELENPYGMEVNHLPLAEMHFAFVEALGEMHQHPMPVYQWATAPGEPKLPAFPRVVK